MVSFQGLDLVTLRLIEPCQTVLQLRPLLPRSQHLLVELLAIQILVLVPHLALGELPLSQPELLLNQRLQLLLLIRLPHPLLLPQAELALEALDPDVSDLHRVLALLPPLPQLVGEGRLHASFLVSEELQTILQDALGAHGISELEVNLPESRGETVFVEAMVLFKGLDGALRLVELVLETLR